MASGCRFVNPEQDPAVVVMSARHSHLSCVRERHGSLRGVKSVCHSGRDGIICWCWGALGVRDHERMVAPLHLLCIFSLLALSNPGLGEVV